jgi:hypothetical protein
MWKSRTKTDLIIEVWEKLDCESVGAKEIEAIETVVREKYGLSAVESPMIIARLLADEGAELRHSEIMELDVARRTESPYDAMFRNVLKFSDFKQTLISIRNLENLRRKFAVENDREGLRLVRDTALKGKKNRRLPNGLRSGCNPRKFLKAGLSCAEALKILSNDLEKTFNAKVLRPARKFQ